MTGSRPVSFLAAMMVVAAAAGMAAASSFQRGGMEGPRVGAFVHQRVRQRAEEHGEARVIVVMGDPSLPQAWARDWRQRGAAIRQLAQKVQRDVPGFRIRRQYNVFPFLAGTADKETIRKLSLSPLVEAVYPDRKHTAVLAQSGPLIGQPYAEDTAHMDGAGVGIAIVDTGIDISHPDLSGRVVAGYNFLAGDPGYPQYTDPNDYTDDEGHGTYVAGIAAGDGAVNRGIAPGARLLALKVLDDTGAGYSSDIIQAIQWCVTNKAAYNIRVINLSLSDGAEWRDPAECDGDPEGQAIADAVDSGIAVVAASGNESYTEGVGMPACASAAIAVGATLDGTTGVNPATPADAVAYFSNRGELVDVYAPGVWITSAKMGGGYETGAGTSAATPHVAGAIAVLAEAGLATPAAVRARLERTGVQIVDGSTDVATPRIDLERALTDQPSSGPDLVVTAVTADSSGELVGQSISCSVSVQNQGTSASDPCTVIISVSGNQVASPQDRELVALDVPSLSAGQTWPSGPVTGVVPATQPGDYWIAAFADSSYVVDEKDETNNGRLGTAFEVETLSSYVSGSSIPATMAKGQTYQISVSMLNGSAVTWTSADGCALSAVSPEGTNRWGVTTVALPQSSVAPGQTATFTFNVTAPSEPGQYPCHWQMERAGQPFGEIATGSTKVRVYDEAEWGQDYASTSGDWTAYEDYSGIYHQSIAVTNSATSARAVLPDDIPFPLQYDAVNQWYEPVPPYEWFDVSLNWFPDVSGPWVTWMVDDYPENEWYFQIAAQNVQNLNVLPLRVTYQAADALFPAIDGTLVVWQDYRNDDDKTLSGDFLQDNSDIYIADLSSVTGPDDHYPEVYPLCTAPGPQLVPRISGNIVVWEDWRDTGGLQSDIYMYDLSVDSDGDGIPNWKEAVRPSPDPAETNLTDSPWSEEYPDIDAGRVVWMDLQRDTGNGETVDIYYRDVDSPTVIAVATEPAGFRYHPRISGTKVVWEDWTQGQPDIYWMDTATGAGGAIAGSASDEEWPDVSGDSVVYSKHRLTLTKTDDYGSAYEYKVFNVWRQAMLQDGSVGVVTFTDVPAGFWAWPYIEAAVASSVVQGYPDGSYQPTATVSRDQMAVYVARALAGGDSNVPPATTDPGFSDVAPDFWAYRHIAYAVDHGVVMGYGDGTYRPAEAVNRGQMAAYIGRALAGGDSFFDTYEPTTVSFPDVPADFWAYGYIEYIVERGVVNGYLDGTYQPNGVVTRDQMAVYISRAFGYLP